MVRGTVKTAAIAALTIGLSLGGCGKSDSGNATATSPPAGAAARLTIAVIPKGTTHSYWKSIHAGADQAGAELGVDIQYKGPLKESDRAGEISIVQQFISDGVSGIVLAPLDSTALVRPVQSATEKKIPVVIIDSSLNAAVGKDYFSYVGTDNHLGGKMAGDALLKVMAGKGKVVMLRYEEGSASTEQREAGFMDAIKDQPGIVQLSVNRFGGATMSESQTAALNMLDQLRQADGVFTPNESSTMGMLLALRQNNLAGKVHFVGFDSSTPLIDALKKGEIDALVAQDPHQMGYLGVKTCVAAIRGQAVPPNVDSGVHLITRDNLETPEIQKLLSAP